MKTILHVIDSTEPGGAETVFVQLAERLQARGYRSVVVISGPGWVHDELLRRGFDPYVIEAKGAFNIALLRALIGIIRREKIDLIQSHLLGSNVYCALAGLLTRRPVIATFHGMVDVDPNERLRWLKFLVLNWGVSRFVTVSQSLCEAIHRDGLLDPARNTVIYNGVDLQRYGKTGGGALRHHLQLPDDAVLVGCLGNLHPAKGYEYLIPAARQVVDRHPSVHFVIAGDIKPHLIGPLRAQLADCNIEDYVHFIGFVDDSAEFLAQLDIFLLPSISEGFSIATIEAMASSLPVVLTRCGGPEEIATPDVDALMIAPGSADEIASAVMKLLSNPETRHRLAKAGREMVERKFSMESMLDAYCGLYKRHERLRSGG